MATSKESLCIESQEESRVDWSDLPADLLRTILKKLYDITDFIYFRAVCKKWRTSTSISDLPPQIPWVLEQPGRAIDNNSEFLRFYSLFSDKIYTIRCPQSHGKSLLGPSHGYLCTTNFESNYDSTYSLLNPLTKDEVTIPFREYSRASLVCMGPDPIGNNDHMAFMDDTHSQMIGFYRPHYWEWDYVEGPPNNSNIGHACLKGMYYRNETGATVVIDIACGSSFLIPAPEPYDPSCQVYFVESAGKILRIAKKSDLNLSVFNFLFDIYQLDDKDENDQARWVKKSSIGDQMLFLDWRNGISVTASESTGLRGNCIYCLESRWQGFLELSCDVYRYNMEDGQTEKIPCPFNKSSTWLVPSVVRFLPDGLH